MKNIILAAMLLIPSLPAVAQESISLESLRPLVNVKSGEKIDGKVLLYFWASWCSDCRDKLANVLPGLKKEFPNVTFLTVNMDRDEHKGKKFAEKENVALPIYRDENKTIAKALKLFGVPAWALISKTDSGGVVHKSTVGAVADEIRSELKRLL